jgi:putative ATP-binding cassette transporter
MKLIKFVLRTSPGYVVFAILAGIIAGASNTGLLVLINATLNRTGTPLTTLAWYFAALCLVMATSRTISSILLIRLSRWSIFDMRMKLCRRIINAPLRHLEEMGAPRLLATLTDDVPAIATALTYIPVMCMHCAVVLTCLVYMAWLSWPVFLAVLVFMVLGILGYRFPFMKGRYYIDASRREWDALFKHFQGLLGGAKELKLHRNRRDAFLDHELEPTAVALRNHGYVADSTYSIAAGVGQLLIFTLIGLLLYSLPNLRSVNAQTLTGYTLIILYIMTPLEYIMNTLPAFVRANVAMQKVESLGLSLKDKSVESMALVPTVQPAGYEILEMDGVIHTYYREDKEQNFILGPIDASFRPGELVFLIGGNGSGKTTFAKLVTALYMPEGGELRLNGQAVTDENRESYRQLFSVVFSDFYLFDKLLGLNLPELDARSHEYLEQLQLAHKVQVHNGILSTTELSQGQRKRLALLTSYLEDRPFYVFDEWAADQDPFFKELFYMQMLPELKARGKTVLVISHDDRYYHIADRTIKLDYGQIAHEPTLVSAGHTAESTKTHEVV